MPCSVIEGTPCVSTSHRELRLLKTVWGLERRVRICRCPIILPLPAWTLEPYLDGSSQLSSLVLSRGPSPREESWCSLQLTFPRQRGLRKATATALAGCHLRCRVCARVRVRVCLVSAHGCPPMSPYAHAPVPTWRRPPAVAPGGAPAVAPRGDTQACLLLGLFSPFCHSH